LHIKYCLIKLKALYVNSVFYLSHVQAQIIIANSNQAIPYRVITIRHEKTANQ